MLFSSNAVGLCCICCEAANQKQVGKPTTGTAQKGPRSMF